MANLFENKNQIRLHSASGYPRNKEETVEMGLSGKRNEEMRAMTIAALRIAQNNNQLSEIKMSHQLLYFLIADSDSAINHWAKKGRLTQLGAEVRLTPDGLAECQNSLHGLNGAYSTTEEKVQEWTRRMLSKDGVTTRSQTFDSTHWHS